jgi:FMN phosphatase YigB (HAD superfamily)
MIEAALRAADVAVDHVLSVEEMRVYNPDPRVYLLMDALAPVKATLFVPASACRTFSASDSL